MTAERPAPDGAIGAAPGDELRELFHRLNNHLGIILAQAEMLELEASGDPVRPRASQIVASALDAIQVSREIVHVTDPSGR
jgi:hypothetical protein